MADPSYTHERNFGCRITETIFHGLRTVTLENELIRVGVLADKGTDIFEFLHKPTDTDFMWRSPLGIRNPATFVPTIPRPEGAFLDYYEGGWQECLPTGGNAAEYAGTNFGAHGEACLLPWNYTIFENTPDRISVRFTVRTYRTPLYLEKTLSLERRSSTLWIDEHLRNEGTVPIDLMWGHHPAFGPPFLDELCVIGLPGGVVRTIHTDTTGRCIPRADQQWPHVQGVAGTTIDLSRIPPVDTCSHDLAFLTGLETGWYTITNTSRHVGFALVWPVEVFGALWFWQVFGGALGQPWYGRTYNIALEPWTTPHATINEAIANGTQHVLAPGASLHATLKAIAYTGDEYLAMT